MSNKKRLEDTNLSTFWLIIVFICALFGGCWWLVNPIYNTFLSG